MIKSFRNITGTLANIFNPGGTTDNVDVNTRLRDWSANLEQVLPAAPAPQDAKRQVVEVPAVTNPDVDTRVDLQLQREALYERMEMITTQVAAYQRYCDALSLVELSPVELADYQQALILKMGLEIQLAAALGALAHTFRSQEFEMQWTQVAVDLIARVEYLYSTLGLGPYICALPELNDSQVNSLQYQFVTKVTPAIAELGEFQYQLQSFQNSNIALSNQIADFITQEDVWELVSESLSPQVKLALEYIRNREG